MQYPIVLFFMANSTSTLCISIVCLSVCLGILWYLKQLRERRRFVQFMVAGGVLFFADDETAITRGF